MIPLLFVLALAASPLERASPVDGLSECARSEAAGRDGWTRVSEPPYSMSLPPGFKKDASARFVHGGSAWESGGRHAQMSWGMWSLASFDSVTTSKPCRFECAGHPAVRFDSQDAGGVSVVLWLTGSGAPEELVVSARSAALADKPLVNAIVLSVCSRE